MEGFGGGWKNGNWFWRLRRAGGPGIFCGCWQGSAWRWSWHPTIRVAERLRRSYESTSVSETDVPEMQGDPPRGRGAGHLRQSEAQAKAGITIWHELRESIYHRRRGSRSDSPTSTASG